MSRFLRLLTPLALVCALLVSLPAAPASSQDPVPEGDWMPLVGTYTLWCTWTGNGGPCDPPSLHHDTPALDIAADPGTPVYAVADGEVVSADGGCAPLAGDGCNNGSGNVVVIDHGDRRSRYLHLSTIEVSLGPVEAGTRLGTTGNSGSTRNAHLHYDEITDESYGDRIDTGDILACHDDVAVSYPQELGFTSWADVPYGSTIRNDGYECLGGSIIVPEPPAPPPPSQYVPVEPVRLFDTRTAAAPTGEVEAGDAIEVTAAGVAGVPTDATAIVVNVTITETSGPGFVTVWPSGLDRPVASSLNVNEVGETVANLVTVPLGDTGAISLYTQGGGHLLGDVAGYYVEVADAVAEGRVEPLVPTRLFDTRAGGGDPVPWRGTIEVPVLGHAGVPTDGVAAVVMNVTATESADEGHVTVWPTGSERPNASNLNLGGENETVPNLVIVPVGADGSVMFYAHGGAHLLADVTAYVTDDSAAESKAGLFVPVTPSRVFDTRDGEPAGYVGRDDMIDVVVASTVVPADAAGVVINVTGTDAAEIGFVTAWPAGVERPIASTLNLAGEDDTRANAALLPVGTDGAVSFYAHRGAHLLADVSGYFLSGEAAVAG